MHIIKSIISLINCSSSSPLQVHSTSQYRISVPLGVEDQYSNEAELSQSWPNGKMLISLCYNTKRRALVVNVKQCINLLPMDNNGSSDPFVKL